MMKGRLKIITTLIRCAVIAASIHIAFSGYSISASGSLDQGLNQNHGSVWSDQAKAPPSEWRREIVLGAAYVLPKYDHLLAVSVHLSKISSLNIRGSTNGFRPAPFVFVASGFLFPVPLSLPPPSFL